VSSVWDFEGTARVAPDKIRDSSSMPCRGALRNLLPPINTFKWGSRLRFEPSDLFRVVKLGSNQTLGLATDWSRAAIPSKSAPNVDAASAGASITTLPLTSRRTLS
jgi:hypothetical protein